MTTEEFRHPEAQFQHGTNSLRHARGACTVCDLAYGRNAPARGWFADIDEEATGAHRWQACLETGTGIVPSISIWFATEEDCLQWIRENVLGVGLLP